jgi:hypothetical protein
MTAHSSLDPVYEKIHGIPWNSMEFSMEISMEFSMEISMEFHDGTMLAREVLG